MAESIVITDGTDSFYESRSIFQALHDFGDYETITAQSSSIADAKKMLLSRQARYSGLVDVLKWSDKAELSDALAGATVWMVLSADAAEVASQVPVAAAAGVKRIFVVMSGDGGGDVATLQTALQSSGLAFTVMRTGKLGRGASGAALKIEEIDAEFDTEIEMSKDDVFRFVAEALTLSGSVGRSFALCPSSDDSQFKEMRLAGCTRREEVEALLAGVITEKPKESEAPVLTPEEEEEKQKSEMERAAEREEELKALLEKARLKGIDNAKKQQEDEEKKAADRAERKQYYATEPDDDKKDPPADEEPPPPPPETPSDGDGGKDGGDEPPLAMA